ncbi:MAG: hypothetical protein M0026_02540 [Nocardiopsaceae bacterium]|nr:hypothetical protein [Nocardiopsaceae bacterium]
MSGPGTTNTAGPDASIGIQADQVHNSAVYQVLPEDPPSRRYEVGLRFLDNGMPQRARELISDAIAHGYDSGQVRFHWILAVLSKRSYRDLTSEERQGLDRISAELHRYPDDTWKRALEAIFELLDCLAVPGDDPDPALKRLRALPPPQHKKIIRHLDLVLTGGMKESLWAETRQSAEEARDSGDRTNRVWAYFEPEPAGARAREPAADSAALGDYVRAVAWSGLFVFAAGYLGWSVLAHADLVPILAYLVALAAGYAGARNGSRWHYKAKRLRDKDREYSAPLRNVSAPEDGFANRVDHSFTHYFTKYPPERVDRDAWLAETAGIRRALRDEVVEIYRESRIGVGQVNWLIRYMARDVRRRWAAGTLMEHRNRYRVEASTKIGSVVSFAVLAAAAMSVTVTAVQESPIIAVISAFTTVVSGRFAAPLWLGIVSEHRRFGEEWQEYHRIHQERIAEYLRWKGKLEATRPSEEEMEAWLNADKMMILDSALRHYRIAWHGIIAHTFLHTPERPCKRARVEGGPWRYSKYEIRVFLITEEGVREVSADLDFERAEVSSHERDNFRFEAVSSVQVEEEGELGYTLHLTLMNGPTKSIVVTGPESRQPGSEQCPSELFKINLDAAGFAHTLRILEGIAAEGKKWIDRNRTPISGGRSFSADPHTPTAPAARSGEPTPTTSEQPF